MLAYLSGEMVEPKFGEMVEHEATCPVCRRLVAEHPSSAPRSAEDDEMPSASKRRAPRAKEFLTSVIARTSGSDCDWVSLRMAEAMDDPLAEESVGPVREHLADCRSCQRLRDQLNALPEYYDALPVLQGNRGFTEAVLARTVGPRPSFLEVVRAIWKSPGTLWESATACALVVAVVFGSALPSFESVSDSVSDSVREVAQSAQVPTVRWGALESSNERPSLLRRWSSGATNAWSGIETKATTVSDWSTRTSEDIRTRDYPGLLEDIRVVLEPLGLYPDSDEKPDLKPEVEAESGVEPDSGPAAH
jgi:hypothetical protein